MIRKTITDALIEADKAQHVMRTRVLRWPIAVLRVPISTPHLYADTHKYIAKKPIFTQQLSHLDIIYFYKKCNTILIQLSLHCCQFS